MKAASAISVSALLFATGLTQSATAVSGQTTKSLTWTDENRVDSRSMVSMLARMSGQGNPVRKSTALHVQGGALIREIDRTASVINLETGEMLMIDHARRSVMRADLATLPELAERMIEHLKTGGLNDPDYETPYILVRHLAAQGRYRLFERGRQRRLIRGPVD